MWRGVLPELLPGQDDLELGERAQVLVAHHLVLGQTGRKLLHHLGATHTKHTISYSVYNMYCMD